MTLQELVRSIPYVDIANALISQELAHPCDIEAYHEVYDTIYDITPTKSDTYVDVSWCEPDEIDIGFCISQPYVNVVGIDEEGKIWGTSFQPWSDWAGVEVRSEKLSKAEVIAHCLWEMTFSGFTEEKVQEEACCLTEMLEDIESGKVECIPLDWDAEE